jgi:hypothetical protein
MIVAALLATAAAAGPAQQPGTQAAPAAAASLPAADPARLAAARRFVDVAVPQSMMEQLVVAAIRAGAEEERGDAVAARHDPHHAERTRIAQRVAIEEASRIMRELDPDIRALFSDFYARTLSLAELEEAALFYSSAPGRRFTAGGMSIALNPEYHRAMDGLRPRAAAALAGADARFAAATAHLPPLPGMPPAAAPAPPAPVAPLPPAEDAARAAPPPYPGPPADAARLASARRAVEMLWPAGPMRRPFDMLPVFEALLAMRIGDFGFAIPPRSGVDPDATVMEIVTGFDPHFGQRLPVLARFVGEEYARVTAAMEPGWRILIAEAYAREFSVAELDEVTRFFSTPAGRRLVQESYRAIEDPQLVRGIALLVPRVVTQIPAVQQRIDRATAHLPQPPTVPVPILVPVPEGGPQPRDADRDSPGEGEPEG